MADFETQVEGLTGLTVGTSPTTAELTQFLNDGVIEVTNRWLLVKPSDASKFLRRSGETTSQGYDPGGATIVSVIRESGTDNDWRECRQVSPGNQSRVTDINSLEYASKFNPVFTIEDDGKIYVYPAPGADPNAYKVYFVNSSPIDGAGNPLTQADDSIGSFPNDKVYLVVLYAGIKSLQNALSAKTSEFPSDLALPVLETTTLSLPTFTAPDVFVMPPAPAGVDVDFSSVGTIESFVAPVPPVLDETSITETNITNPDFIGPAMEPLDWTDTEDLISNEEDSEMLGSRVSEIQAKIQEFAAKTDQAKAAFAKDSAIMQKDAQIAMKNADIFEKNKLVKYQGEVQAETARITASIQNFGAEVQKAIQEYQSETKYDLTKYQAEVQAQVQKHANDLQHNKINFDSNLAKYAAEVQKVNSTNQVKVALFQSTLQDYMAKINKISKDYEWMSARYVNLYKEYNMAFGMAPKKKESGQGQTKAIQQILKQLQSQKAR